MTAFDALNYYENLTAAGVPDEQAKAQANALKEVLEHFYLKMFFRLRKQTDAVSPPAQLACALSGETGAFKFEKFESQIALEDRLVSRDYLDVRLHELELRLKYDLTIRLEGIVVACTTILLGGLPLIIMFMAR